MPIWPGNPGVELERIKKIEEGDSSNVSRVAMGVHTGTHVDAPVHFIPGAQGAETLPLDILTGRARVVHLLDVAAVTLDALERVITQVPERLLIRTRNSEYWRSGDPNFHPEMVGLTEEAARWIAVLQIKLVGVDYLSVAPPGQGGPVHRVLLQAGVVIVEGLNLSDVAAGEYQLWCLPLKLVGSDGAPARAILQSLES